MRGLKKLLALLLAVTMIASVLTVPVFAADEVAPLSSGAKLELLGLLLGDGEGVTEAYLAKSSTRMQLAILNARWLGYEQEAYDFEDWDDETNFVDYDDRTSEAEWNMLAYYYADEDLGFIGIGYDVFAPQDNITNKQLAKILLVAMGYPYGVEYDWDDILLFAGDIGINLGSREVGITNKAMADAIVSALESLTTFVDDDGNEMTFAQYLLGLGIVTEDDLKAAGIAYEPGKEPGEDVEKPTLEVVSAKADNFVEVDLTFNQKVSADSLDWAIAKIDNLNVSSKAKVYIVEGSDDKVVRIFEPVGFVGAQNEYRTISLTGLKTPGGIAMTAFSQQITFRDSSAPSIEKVVAKGNSRLDVYFSEPLETNSSVKTLANYQVGGKALSASAPTINDDADEDTSRIVTIKNIRTSLSPGVYILGVLGTNFRDFAGNTLGYQTADFEIVAKTEGPIAQKVLDPVFQYKVMIEFDDEIQEDASIRWVSGSKTNSSDKTTVKDNVATFEFTSDSKCLPIGGTTITLVGAKDYWGNAAQQPLSFDVVPVADTFRPAVMSYGADVEGTIWIKFNKKLDAATATNNDNYIIKNGDGDRTYDWNIKYEPEKDDRKVILESSGSDSKKPGLYKITLKGIKDTVRPASVANTILDVTIEVNVPDTVAPSIVSATWGWAQDIAVGSRRIINIFFDEELDYSSAVTRSNFRTRVTGESYKALPNDAQVGLQPGNRTVTITFRTGFDATKAVEVSAIDVQDLYGNRSNDASFVGDKVLSKVKSTKATGIKKIEMEFTTEITAFDPANFAITDVSGNVLAKIGVDDATLNGDGNKATIILTADLSANAKFNGGPVYVKETLMDVDKSAGNVYEVADGITPSASTDSFWWKSDDYAIAEDKTALFLIFNENVTFHTSANGWGNLVDGPNSIFPDLKIGSDVFVNGAKEKDGYIVTWTVDAPVQIGTTNDYFVKIKFVKDSANVEPKFKGADITFTYNAFPGRTIEDLAGNKIGSGGLADIKFSGVRFGV